jgi:hypothetical protein
LDLSKSLDDDGKVFLVFQKSGEAPILVNSASHEPEKGYTAILMPLRPVNHETGERINTGLVAVE